MCSLGGKSHSIKQDHEDAKINSHKTNHLLSKFSLRSFEPWTIINKCQINCIITQRNMNLFTKISHYFWANNSKLLKKEIVIKWLLNKLIPVLLSPFIFTGYSPLNAIMTINFSFWYYLTPKKKTYLEAVAKSMLHDSTEVHQT